LARQLQDQVHPCFSRAIEVALLELAQCREPFAQALPHPHQPERIPAGMARNGELMEIRQQARL
jgi:hypothetical protein